MKKTVSINIGSIIFHIEEDGYEKLKSYLDSVNKYFSNFEDSAEIIADIESRIAEIFFTKLDEGKQTVSIEDVEELMVTMGTTSDFDASLEPEAEENQAKTEEQAQTNSEAKKESWEGFDRVSKTLYRDTRRKMLGGVASGIAHYFSIDPLWVRLAFLGLFFNVFFAPFSGAALLGYIIMWVVVPANAFLEEDSAVKKLFRDGERRVLGGVSSGIAAYFGIDISVVRLLFVLSIFLGGSGLIAYIILWIITPEARSITEKMQMQGEPVTLSNIEQNVKKGLKMEEGEESPLVKVLLFPFRLIAIIINGLGKFLGPAFGLLGEILRIAFGIFLSLLGFAIMVGLTMGLFGLFGMAGADRYVHIGEIPIELIQRSLDSWSLAAGYTVLVIPALALSLLGLVIILKRRVANAYVGWSLFTVWVAALIFATFSIPRFASEFASEDDIRIEKIYPVNERVPVLKLNDLVSESFDGVDLRLRGHSDENYMLTLNIESRGSSRKNAQENAKAVNYNVVQKGDDFYFDSDISFPKEAQYRFQSVKAYFYIPYGKTFRMDEDLAEILVNTLNQNGYKSYQMEGNEWTFDRDGIQCLTCPGRSGSGALSSGSLSSANQSTTSDGQEKIAYPFEDFDEVVIASYFDIDIRQGKEWEVIVRGEDDDLDDVYVNQVGDKLEVKFKEDSWEWWRDRKKDKVNLYIVMPELEYLQVIGDTDGEVKDFEGDELEIEAIGGCDLYVDVSYNDIEVSLTGASSLDLNGETKDLTASVIGASSLSAYDMLARRTNISAVGASKAEVYGSDEIEITSAGVSKVRYRGTDNVTINEAGISSIQRD
ncbi:MAG: PspC domain-containing protein [Cyclobacteriaceae bacterium]